MKAALALAMALSPAAVGALDVGEEDFHYVSELVADGFAPFATSASGNATFGMTDGSRLYLCFIADTSTAQATRQTVLLAEIQGQAPARTVPNIPVVCIKTQ